MTTREQALEAALREARDLLKKAQLYTELSCGDTIKQIDAALSLPQDDGWRDIASAPKERPGIIWVSGSGCMRLVWWGGTQWIDYQRDVPVERFFEPRVWRPLPPAPERTDD